MKNFLFCGLIFCALYTGCSKSSDNKIPDQTSKTHTIRIVSTGNGAYGNYVEILKPGETMYTVIDSQDNVTAGSYEYTTKQDVGTTVRLELMRKTATNFTFTFYNNGDVVGNTQNATGEKVTTDYLIK